MGDQELRARRAKARDSDEMVAETMNDRLQPGRGWDLSQRPHQAKLSIVITHFQCLDC